MSSLFRVGISALKKLTWPKIWQAAALVFRHPGLFVMSLPATRKTWKIARQKFPDTHGRDGVGNAFRHALWTALLASYGSKISSPKKAVDFALKLSDLHEDLFPNPPLARAMDLQNNRVGVGVYQEMIQTVHRQFIETSFVVEALEKKLPAARRIQNLTEAAGRDLVYLERD